MFIVLNNNIVSENKKLLSFKDRGFQYADGLFESIIVRGGNVGFLDFHIERIVKGMKALGMKVPEEIYMNNVEIIIKELIGRNEFFGDCRMKLLVWRKEGGLYTPLNNEVNWAIIPQTNLPEPPKEKERVGFCEKVKLCPSVFSQFKTCNALNYVIAAMERQEKNLNDLIIKDFQGNISECCSSNIFWITDGVFYTPSLETGCIAGVMRRVVMEELSEEGKEIREVMAKEEEMFKAEEIFTTNVNGIIPIRSIVRGEEVVWKSE